MSADEESEHGLHQPGRRSWRNSTSIYAEICFSKPKRGKSKCISCIVIGITTLFLMMLVNIININIYLVCCFLLLYGFVVNMFEKYWLNHMLTTGEFNERSLFSISNYTENQLLKQRLS